MLIGAVVLPSLPVMIPVKYCFGPAVPAWPAVPSRRRPRRSGRVVPRIAAGSAHSPSLPGIPGTAQPLTDRLQLILQVHQAVSHRARLRGCAPVPAHSHPGAHRHQTQTATFSRSAHDTDPPFGYVVAGLRLSRLVGQDNCPGAVADRRAVLG